MKKGFFLILIVIFFNFPNFSFARENIFYMSQLKEKEGIVSLQKNAEKIDIIAPQFYGVSASMQLTGGLGNNLFQYAAGKYLALKTNASLVLDLSIIDFGLTHHGYYLRYMFQDFREIKKSENFIISRKLHNLFSRLSYKNRKRLTILAKFWAQMPI